jgi:GNAT superfamily N-acetyltransferase
MARWIPERWTAGWTAWRDRHRAPGAAALSTASPPLAARPLDSEVLAPRTEAPPAPGAPPLRLRRIENAQSPDFDAFRQFVLEASADYRWQVQGRLPMLQDVDRILGYRPKGLAADRKYVWGIWQNERLVGCLEVLRGWPTPDCLYIGLLLIDPRWQGKGLGRRVLGLLAERTKAWPQVKRWRISVVKNQVGALRFWRKQGFHPTGESQDASFVAPLLNLERRLHH